MLWLVKLFLLTAFFFVVGNSAILIEITQPLYKGVGSNCVVPPDLQYICDAKNAK